MAPPSRSARGFGVDASGTVWEVGLVTMPAFVAQADGSTVRPLIALVMEAGGAICARHLDDDYRALIHEAVAALARKRPSPLLTGRDASWCAGVVHAIGSANFLFDATQSPHCSAATIAAHFGVATSTSHNHARKVRDLLKITPWILEVDGFLRDIRSLPIEVQLQAAAKGLIPYVPALRAQPRGRA